MPVEGVSMTQADCQRPVEGVIRAFVCKGVHAQMLLFFFFSSRRRHTRFDCDWSSDVCSSDLGPYTFSIAAGALPTGLILNGSTGAITGTPSNPGTANFTVGAVDSVGNTGSQPYVVKIAGVVSNNVSLPVISTSYDPTPSPGLAGRFTINTTLTNN